MDYHTVGKDLIESSIQMDNALAELLKLQTQKMKKLIKTSSSIEELENANTLLKNIIFALMLTDEKIKYGMELWKQNE